MIEKQYDPTETDDAPAHIVIAAIIRCASYWESDARILGNIRAKDVIRALSPYPAVRLNNDPGYLNKAENAFIASPDVDFETALEAFEVNARTREAMSYGRVDRGQVSYDEWKSARKAVIDAHTTALSRAREEERKLPRHFVLNKFVRELREAIERKQAQKGGMQVGMPKVAVSITLDHAQALVRLLFQEPPTDE